MNSIRSHKDLDVWKLSMELCSNIYKYTDKFPDYEKYGLWSQIIRASVSVPANIAEGSAFKKSYPKVYRRHLYIALGSLSEVDTLLEIAINLKYLSSIEEEQKKIIRIRQMLFKIIRKLNKTYIKESYESYEYV